MKLPGRKQNKAFSIIELLVVLAVIGVFVGIAYPNISNWITDRNVKKEAYEVILNQYDDSPKLPDAMYGLSLAYQGLGNIPQARQLLNEIKRRFRNTGAASLADTRLLQLD